MAPMFEKEPFTWYLPSVFYPPLPGPSVHESSSSRCQPPLPAAPTSSSQPRCSPCAQRRAEARPARLGLMFGPRISRFSRSQVDFNRVHLLSDLKTTKDWDCGFHDVPRSVFQSNLGAFKVLTAIFPDKALYLVIFSLCVCHMYHGPRPSHAKPIICTSAPAPG